MRLSAERQRDLVGDLQAVAFERDHLARMIGEHAQLREAEIDQNLRADAALMLQQALPRRVAVDFARVWYTTRAQLA